MVAKPHTFSREFQVLHSPVERQRTSLRHTHFSQGGCGQGLLCPPWSRGLHLPLGGLPRACGLGQLVNGVSEPDFSVDKTQL